MKPTKTALLIVSCLLLGFSSQAATPPLINYQCVISGPGGQPLDTTVTVIFKIWDSPTLGNNLWTETHTSLTITDGKLSVLLGSITTITDQLFSDTGRYLGIKIGDDSELSPRSRLLSVPYALRLATLDGASGGDVAGALQISADPVKATGDALIIKNTLGSTVLSVKASAVGVAVSLFDPVDSKDGFAMVPIERVLLTDDGMTMFDSAGTDTTIMVSSNGNIIGIGQIIVGPSSSGSATATVFGGNNTANGISAAIGGGLNNSSAGNYSTVGGGYYDSTKGIYSGVFSGYSNLAGDGTSDTAAFVGGGYNNQVTSKYASVLGGQENMNAGSYAVIGGGYGNKANNTNSTIAGGSNNVAGGDYSVIGGGSFDTTSGDYSTIAGGYSNKVSSAFGTIAGGSQNETSNNLATVAGGGTNSAAGYAATIGGGSSNYGVGNYSAIGGGESDSVKGIYSGVSSGYSNLAGDGTSDTAAFVGGGYNNQALSKFATVAGGFANNASEIGSTIGGGGLNTTLGVGATIAGGTSNSTGAADGSTIGGGTGNSAAGYTSTIAGGESNTVSGSYSFVGGGQYDTTNGIYSGAASGYSNLAGDASADTGAFIGGGYDNRATGKFASVGGGINDTASGNYSTIPGGRGNIASSDYAFAAGRLARAVHAGAFVWKDATTTSLSSTTLNQFSVRASGGVRFYTNLTDTSGVTMGAGASSWTSVSDKSVKKDFREINSEELLKKLSEIPISRWKYIAEESQADHIGPMSQDFYSAFGLGDDNKRISTIDADGVALAAIQALYKQVEELKAEIKRLKEEKEK